ncbi:hypothetical protein DM860_012002 [Cuscuta australis]|uniref:Uncharacterized protein n=1 Tax=Cuscuta australis TaxID=267555 RepID=A0A328DDE1_9ASTE|nr:hypothetical protein DM860_012002 [Cuscuta australis]
MKFWIGKYEKDLTYRRAADHGRLGVVVAEVEGEFHAGIPAADDDDFLAAEILAGLVIAGVDNFAVELLQPFDIRDDRLGILAGGDDEPLAEVHHLLAGGGDGGPDLPHSAGLVIASGADALVEARVQAEVGGVGFEVVDELGLRRVLRVVLREGEVRELAELLGEVELEAVVGAFLPQRGNAVGPLEDDERDVSLFQASSDGEAGRAGADDQRAVDPHTPAPIG